MESSKMRSALVYRHALQLSESPMNIPLEFRVESKSLELVFEPHREGWECMACAETYGCGVKPLLKLGDLARHAEAHQMGLDYALILKKKGILK